MLMVRPFEAFGNSGIVFWVPYLRMTTRESSRERAPVIVWSAVAERSGDTALAATCRCLRVHVFDRTSGESKAVSPLRSATALHTHRRKRDACHQKQEANPEG